MNHDEVMQQAIWQAKHALEHDDVPIGAVVVRGDEVLAARHNERELQNDPTAHAEILALQDAARKLGTWHLEDCSLIVTLEPCPMCAGAAVNARIKEIVFGASDPKAGACGTLYNLAADPRLNHEITVTRGVLTDECGALLTEFFSARR